jgi:hypothetical protein
MVNRYAIIEADTVANIAVAEAPLADNWVQSDVACIGWTYDGETFTPPPPPPAPTPEELDAQARAQRAAAYVSEADPLFFKWQAGEGTKEDWEAKRAEIRARYPYAGDDA